MKLSCNIDRRGARKRLYSGIAMIALGVIALGLALFHKLGMEWAPWPLIASIALFGMGALAVFEGLNYW